MVETGPVQSPSTSRQCAGENLMWVHYFEAGVMASEIEKFNDKINTGIIKTISDFLLQLGIPLNIAVPLSAFLLVAALVAMNSAFKKWKRGGSDTGSVWHRVNVEDDAIMPMPLVPA